MEMQFRPGEEMKHYEFWKEARLNGIYHLV
jgi:hypothetical protein